MRFPEKQNIELWCLQLVNVQKTISSKTSSSPPSSPSFSTSGHQLLITTRLIQERRKTYLLLQTVTERVQSTEQPSRSDPQLFSTFGAD